MKILKEFLGKFREESLDQVLKTFSEYCQRKLSADTWITFCTTECLEEILKNNLREIPGSILWRPPYYNLGVFLGFKLDSSHFFFRHEGFKVPIFRHVFAPSPALVILYQFKLLICVFFCTLSVSDTDSPESSWQTDTSSSLATESTPNRNDPR